MAVIAILVLLAGVIVQVSIGGSIKSAIIKKINASISTELAVKGDIDFSVFRSFPYFSLNFDDVALKEKKSFGNEDLLVAKEISFQFSIWNLFAKNYTINRVKITNGKLLIKVSDKGDRNYFIFNSSPGNQTDNTQIQINKIIITGLEAVYEDEQNNQHYAMNFNSAKLSGNFSASQFTMDIDAKMLVEKLDVDGIDYLHNKETNVSLLLDVDLDKGHYSFKNSKVRIGASNFKLDGTVQEEKDDFALDLSINGKDVGLEELATLLPDEYNRNLVELDTKGDLTFNGFIKGPLSSTKNPVVNFVFDVKNATVKHRPSGQHINDVSFTARYNNGAKHSWGSSVLAVENGRASFKGKPFAIAMTLTQFNNPLLSASLNGTLDLATIAPFFGMDSKSEVTGEVQLDHFTYKGLLKSLGNEKTLATQTQGSVKIINASYKSGGIHISDINSSIASRGGNLELQSLRLKAGSSDISCRGEFANLVPFVVTSLRDSAYYPSNAFSYNLEISSVHLDTKDFAGNSKSSGGSTMLTPLLACGAGKATLSLGNLQWGKFTANNIKTELTVKDKVIYFNKLNVDALHGNVLAGGSVSLAKKNSVALESTVNCRNINIDQLFYEFENFDQQTLTDKNLKGILNSQFYVKAYWKNGVFLSNDLVVVADVTIDKGELNHFKPLSSLSKFVKVQDLENIRFSKLSNQVEIKNGMVNIPTTTIFTNALNLELTGTHSLTNIINYHIKLNFMQLLSGKFRNTNNFDPDATEKDVNGLLNLYVWMTGPGDNPTIRYDKRSVKTIIKTSIKQEGSELKNVLKREFSKEQTQQQQIKDWSPPEKYEMLDLDSDSTSKK